MLYKEGFRIQAIEDKTINKLEIQWLVARMDEVHPIASGNKLFKLKGFLHEFANSNASCIVTAGGAYSNHLSATAWMTKQQNIPCFGIVRGDYPKTGSPTLDQCKAWGMNLLYLPAHLFRILDIQLIKEYFPDLPDFFFIPAGGFHPIGLSGFSNVWKQLSLINPTHLTCSIGTGTTFAGLFEDCPHQTQLIGVPALKGLSDFEARWGFLKVKLPMKSPEIWNEAHWGGYAKKNAALIDFMNEFYNSYNIPTDFVYTAKHFHAVQQRILAGSFPPGSRIVSLHTGGLQGNASLPKQTLSFG
jgi:1-aminocyclopropane-1-carboxylate deaminase